MSATASPARPNRSMGTGLRNAAYPMPDPGTARWGDRYEDRRRIGEFLGLEVGIGAALRSAAVVLGPMISGLLAVALPDA